MEAFHPEELTFQQVLEDMEEIHKEPRISSPIRIELRTLKGGPIKLYDYEQQMLDQAIIKRCEVRLRNLRPTLKQMGTITLEKVDPEEQSTTDDETTEEGETTQEEDTDEDEGIPPEEDEGVPPELADEVWESGEEDEPQRKKKKIAYHMDKAKKFMDLAREELKMVDQLMYDD